MKCAAPKCWSKYTTYITVKTEPGISVWPSERKRSLLAIRQTFLSAFLRLSNVVDLLKRENIINWDKLLFIGCARRVKNFQNNCLNFFYVGPIYGTFFNHLLWSIFQSVGRYTNELFILWISLYIDIYLFHTYGYWGIPNWWPEW